MDPRRHWGNALVKRIKDGVYLYVEGGGSDISPMRRELREAFAEFFLKTPLGNERRPRVVPCGSRQDAYEAFATAVAQGRNALLLVDSESLVSPGSREPADDHCQWKPWAHLKAQDGWERPGGATDLDCHLMAQCMESWLVADWSTLATFYGQGFNDRKRPTGSIEGLDKAAVYNVLAQATKSCKTKSSYGKGEHSFKLLACMSATTVTQQCPWARRLIDELQRRRPP